MNNHNVKRFFIPITIASLSMLFLFSQQGVAATSVSKITKTIAGGKVKIKSEAHSETRGDVRWILPGKRMLDPAVFGTPGAPLGFEAGVGVPIAMRMQNEDGSAWTTTKGVTPFSNNVAIISGEYKFTVVDKTLFDHPASGDKVHFSTRFRSPDDTLEYKITVNKVIPVGPDHPFMGGVASNFIQHGTSGIGTKLMPTSPTYVAFWGVGTLEINGVEVANNRVVHVMTTCKVRDKDYKLVFDNAVDCSAMHTHMLLPNVAVTKTGPVKSPVPTGFILPNGVEQPFMHIMYENIEVSKVATDE